MGKHRRTSNKVRTSKYQKYKEEHRNRIHKLNQLKRRVKRMKKGPDIVANYKKFLNKIGVYV